MDRIFGMEDFVFIFPTATIKICLLGGNLNHSLVSRVQEIWGKEGWPLKHQTFNKSHLAYDKQLSDFNKNKKKRYWWEETLRKQNMRQRILKGQSLFLYTYTYQYRKLYPRSFPLPTGGILAWILAPNHSKWGDKQVPYLRKILGVSYPIEQRHSIWDWRHLFNQLAEAAHCTAFKNLKFSNYQTG